MLDGIRARAKTFVIPPKSTIGCPVQASLGVFGRKWALVVLRDVAFLKGARYSDILRRNKGLTPRVLVWRLKELEDEGIIMRLTGDDKREIFYELTPKGLDAMPMLTALIYYGTKHHSKDVFADGRSRSMSEMFPDSQRELLQGLAGWAAREKRDTSA